MSAPQKFFQMLAPSALFRTRHVPPPQTKFLDPPPAGPTFNLTHATPLTVGR